MERRRAKNKRKRTDTKHTETVICLWAWGIKETILDQQKRMAGKYTAHCPLARDSCSPFPTHTQSPQPCAHRTEEAEARSPWLRSTVTSLQLWDPSTGQGAAQLRLWRPGSGKKKPRYLHDQTELGEQVSSIKLGTR